jgi:putative redox protein
LDASVTWKGKLSFTATADSGFSLPLGGSPESGGDDDGFRPMEMFAIGLAGCTAMDVISILMKKRQDVTAFDVKVHAERATEHPKVITSAVIEYIVSGRNVDEAAVLRSIELSATRYCPAHAMLGQVMPIAMKYQIFEDLGEGERRLVKSGDYVPAQAQVNP